MAADQSVTARILDLEEEITKRLGFEDLLWLLFRQIWVNHWELNVDLVCWLDDCRTSAELECALDIAKDFWTSLGHLRKMIVDDMMNNGQAINELVNNRRAEYKRLQHLLLPGEPGGGGDDARALQALFTARESAGGAAREYFSTLIDIGCQIDDMISSSASSDRGELWKKSQMIFEHNDKVSEALILEPSKFLKRQFSDGREDTHLLDRLNQISRTQRAFSVPPYSLTESEIERAAADPPPPKGKLSESDPLNNMTGPMWLYAASWSDSTRLILPQIIAQALAVCARSSAELVDAHTIACARSSYKFLTRNERPKLQRCSSAPCRPALVVKLEEPNWPIWAQEFGEPLETVLSERLTRMRNQVKDGEELSSSIDLARIRSMVIFQSGREPDKIFDENLTKRWISSLEYVREWFDLQNYLPGSELNKSTSATAIYLITEKIPNQIARKLVEMSKLNPLLTKVIGYSQSAGLSILCRTVEHRYDPPPPSEGRFHLVSPKTNETRQPARPAKVSQPQHLTSFRDFLKRSGEEGGKAESPPSPTIVGSALGAALDGEAALAGVLEDQQSPLPIDELALPPLFEDRANMLRTSLTPMRLPALATAASSRTEELCAYKPTLADKVSASVQVTFEDLRVCSQESSKVSEKILQVLDEIKGHYEVLAPVIRNLPTALSSGWDSNPRPPALTNSPPITPAPFTCYSGQLPSATRAAVPTPAAVTLRPSAPSNYAPPAVAPGVYYELAGEPIVVRRQTNT